MTEQGTRIDWSFLKPRDPERIAPMLALLEVLWRRHPDLRLGQLISNLADAKDVFNIEDDELLDAIKKSGFTPTGNLPTDG